LFKNQKLVKNDVQIQNGDLVLVDAAGELSGFYFFIIIIIYDLV